MRHVHADLLQGGWNRQFARFLRQVHQQLHELHLNHHLCLLLPEDLQSRRPVWSCRHLFELPARLCDLHFGRGLPVLRVWLQIRRRHEQLQPVHGRMRSLLDDRLHRLQCRLLHDRLDLFRLPVRL